MSNKMRLCPMPLGLAFGVVWGLSIFVMGLLAQYMMFGKPFVDAMGTVYIGYEATILGSLIGGIIGFVDAFIFGALVAWLYNLFCGCQSCKKEECHDKTSHCG